MTGRESNEDIRKELGTADINRIIKTAREIATTFWWNIPEHPIPKLFYQYKPNGSTCPGRPIKDGTFLVPMNGTGQWLNPLCG